jgi:hypothetical protein
MSVDNLDIQRLIQKLADAGAFAVLAKEFYETGTWTPAYFGGTTAGVTTHSAQSGYYIRIGGVVYAWGVVGWTAATGTGNARISLPFTMSSTPGFGIPVTLRLSGVTYAGDSPQGIINNATNFFTIEGVLSNGAPTTSAVEAAGTVSFTTIYPIAA